MWLINKGFIYETYEQQENIWTPLVKYLNSAIKIIEIIKIY